MEIAAFFLFDMFKIQRQILSPLAVSRSHSSEEMLLPCLSITLKFCTFVHFITVINRYNDIYRVQMPNITPHVCRHTYCSNMAKSGMNPKTLQYLMGHSDISVTMNVYTHISFDDAEEELRRMEEFRKAQAEVEKQTEKKVVTQKMFKVV